MSTLEFDALLDTVCDFQLPPCTIQKCRVLLKNQLSLQIIQGFFISSPNIVF